MEQRFHFDGLMRTLDAEVPNQESRLVFSFIHYTCSRSPYTPVNTASPTQYGETFRIDPAIGYDWGGTVVKLLWGRAAPLRFPPSLLIGLWRARKVGFPWKRKTLGTDPWCCCSDLTHPFTLHYTTPCTFVTRTVHTATTLSSHWLGYFAMIHLGSHALTPETKSEWVSEYVSQRASEWATLWRQQHAIAGETEECTCAIPYL